MTLVIDASIAVALYVNLPTSAAAAEALDGSEWAAPDLLFSEVANVGWKLHRTGSIDEMLVLEMLAGLRHVIGSGYPGADLAEPAFLIAKALNHPVYDCVYLALTEILDTRLVTADRRLATACAASAWSTRVHLVVAP